MFILHSVYRVNSVFTHSDNYKNHHSMRKRARQCGGKNRMNQYIRQ